MCGGGGPGISAYSPPLPAKYADKVVAMVQMGDPRFMAGRTFDMGTNKMMNGVSLILRQTREREVDVESED
jgi:hypothetical protein